MKGDSRSLLKVPFTWVMMDDISSFISSFQTYLGYKHYGLNRGIQNGKAGLWYREWAPGAKALALVGEFNDWTPKTEHWAVKNTFGVWELFLPDGPNGKPVVPHRWGLFSHLSRTSYL